MLRHLSRETPEERIHVTETPPRRQAVSHFWTSGEGKPGGTGRSLTAKRQWPGHRPGKKRNLGKKLLFLLAVLCLWRTLALDRNNQEKPRSCAQDNGMPLLQPLALQSNALSLDRSQGTTTPFEAAWPQCRRRPWRRMQSGTKTNRKKVSGTGGPNFRPMGYRLPYPRQLQQASCWQDEQQSTWRQEHRLSRSVTMQQPRITGLCAMYVMQGMCGYRTTSWLPCYSPLRPPKGLASIFGARIH
eukprot:5304814-Amphidinium_carterae.2